MPLDARAESFGVGLALLARSSSACSVSRVPIDARRGNSAQAIVRELVGRGAPLATPELYAFVAFEPVRAQRFELLRCRALFLAGRCTRAVDSTTSLSVALCDGPFSVVAGFLCDGPESQARRATAHFARLDAEHERAAHFGSRGLADE